MAPFCLTRRFAFSGRVLLGVLGIGCAAACVTNVRTVTPRNEAAPAELKETIPEAPSETAVWRAGYWHWTGRGYAWRRGSWEEPPPSPAD